MRLDLITCVSNNLLTWHPSLGSTEVLPCLPSFSRTQCKDPIELSTSASLQASIPEKTGGVERQPPLSWASRALPVLLGFPWPLPTLPGITGRAAYMKQEQPSRPRVSSLCSKKPTAPATGTSLKRKNESETTEENTLPAAPVLQVKERSPGTEESGGGHQRKAGSGGQSPPPRPPPH